MKNLKLTVFTFILTTTTVFSQIGDPDMSDRWTIKDVTITEMENENDEIQTIKQVEITEEFTPVMLDPKDKYKLNQDIIYMPTQVTTTLKLDYDKDNAYEKEIKFKYKKPENYDLDFTLTKDGLIILTDKIDLYVLKMWDKKSKNMFSNIKQNRIKRESDYTVELSNGEKVELAIVNYDIH